MAERVTAVGETTSLADRKRRAGQRLVIGISGTGVTAEERRLIADLQPAGFILFARNIEEPAQVLELNRELASLVDEHRPALLCVDQEGGRVQRIREPATRWPPMRTVGNAPHLVAEVSKAMAIELAAMGFNLNFAPVADVDSNPDNPIIGDRAFSNRANLVAEQVVAFLKAHQKQGIVACAKHFPGHGDTTTDSHLELPVVERDPDDLRHLELPPFRAAVGAGVGSVMSAHVVFPAWDEELPATLSPKVLPRLLRDELGFGGVVFSDDMEMKAVHGRWSPEQQVTLGTRASIDIFLACKTPELQEALYRELIYAQERDPGHERASRDAVARVDALRERFFLRRKPRPGLDVLGSQAHRDLALRAIAEGGA